MTGDDDRRRRIFMNVIGLRRGLRGLNGLGRRLRPLRAGRKGDECGGREQEGEFGHQGLQKSSPAYGRRYIVSIP